MKALIIYAHPEEKSFNSALRKKTVSIFKELGHEVIVSDLYTKNFKVAASKDDFLKLTDPNYLNYMMEQKNASEKGLFIKEIAEEQRRIRWADLIIFHFPLWWFSVPAILKAWFDRVLATGFAWDFGTIYEKGLLAGKKGMLVVTTGGPESVYNDKGPHGTSINQVLYNINHGVLYFCGMEVLPPFIAYSVFQAGEEGRKKYLLSYEEYLKNIENLKPLKMKSILD